MRHDHLPPGPTSKTNIQKHSQGPFRFLYNGAGWSGLPAGTYTDWKAPPAGADMSSQIMKGASAMR